MVTTASLLDALRVRLNMPTDSALARYFQVQPPRIAQYRAGVSCFSDDKAVEIADLLGYKREFVLCSIHAERARKTGNIAVAEAFERINRALFSTLRSQLLD